MKTAVLLLLAAAPAQARPVVVEMFTSEACSSCPPADAYLAELAKQPGILALSFNVTYWNSPAWTDPYSLNAATERQGFYAGLVNAENVFTPEAVVDGGAQLTGSDRAAVSAAINAARAAPAGDVAVDITGGAMITVHIGAGPGGATAWLFGYDSEHSTSIGGGENGGARLTEVNVVRSVSSLGNWTGPEMSFTIPRPAGAHSAVLLQTSAGAILGAASQ